MRPSASQLVLLVASLVAAAALETFSVSADQLAENRARWEVLDAAGKEGLRRTWASFRELSEEERRVLRQRMATLSRLQVQHTRRLGAAAGEDELRQLLEELPGRFRSRLGAGAQDPGALAAQVRQRTRTRIDAFLDSLVALGRLDPVERPDGGSLPWREFVQRGLELRTAEELALAERVGAPGGDELPAFAVATEDPPEDPLDVAESMREHRRIVGYLGRAARYLNLTPEERRELADLPDEQLYFEIKARMESRIRALLEERAVDPSLIEAILNAPFRVQERRLDELLAGA